MKKQKKPVKMKTTKGKKVETKKQQSPALWNPFELSEDANRLFSHDPWISPWLRHWGWRRPWAGLWLGQDLKEIPLDIMDKGPKYKIVAELPGVTKEDVEIIVTPNNISICGKTETETKEEDEGYIQQERSYSTLCRNLVFPEEVNPDGAEATLRDGILEIEIKKKTVVHEQRRKIHIK